MKRKLKLILILLLGLILVFWVGDLMFLIPAKVSDRAVAGGWAEDSIRYKNELTESRLSTLFYAIPAIIFLVVTVRSYGRK